MFIGRTDAKAETLVLWPPHAKSWLIGKDSDAGRDWGQEEKGMTEDEISGQHQRLDGHEFEWTPGVGDGQGGLACCDSWGHKESDMTEQLNWIELIFHLYNEKSKTCWYYSVLAKIIGKQGLLRCLIESLRLDASTAKESIPSWGTKIPHIVWHGFLKKLNSSLCSFLMRLGMFRAVWP